MIRPLRDMASQITAPLQPNLVPRQKEEASTDRSQSAASWFYIVDVEAKATEETHSLGNAGKALALSATEADANTATALNGLGVVYFADLSEIGRRGMIERIESPQHKRV